MNRQLPRGRLLAVLCLGVLLAGAVVPSSRAEVRAEGWQIKIVDPDDCWYPSLALNGAGHPRIAYGALGELKYAWYDGVGWQTEFVEEQPGSTGWYASLALDSLDEPRISYHSPYSDSLMYAAHYSATWHIETLGTPYGTGGQTWLGLDSAGLPHIAFWDYEHLEVGYAHYDGAVWQFGTVATMTTGAQGVSLALALDSTDRPHLCYYDYEAAALMHGLYDGFAWKLDVVDDDVFYNGQDCSIVFGADDRPHIAYRDLGLWYATLRPGGGWQRTEVDDDFFAGDGVSLALDSAGRPHISYADWTDVGQELRYASSSGPGWHIETVEIAADTRRFADTSLALDGDDRPHVGYWDLGAQSTLKYATRAADPPFHVVYLPLIARGY